MKVIKLISIMLLLLLTSCASRGRISVTSHEMPVSEEAEALEIPSREAVFVYGNNNNLPDRIILKLNGEPVLFPSGYVRLAGVVSGRANTACFEIGGRGLAAMKGEEIDGYRVAGIDDGIVVLERRKR